MGARRPSRWVNSQPPLSLPILTKAMPANEVIVPLSVRPMPRDTFSRPMHDLRISVMDRCNFRCPYCMPRETFHERYRFLGSHERLSFEEIVRLARLFVQLGVRKLRLTGGEPLLRTNLADLIGDLTAIPGVEDVALTTNGVLLARYAGGAQGGRPEARHRQPRQPRSDAVFARMSGGFGGVAEVLDGIEHARRAELTPIKINAVVQRGVNDHTALDLVERFRGTGVDRALHRVHGRRQPQSLALGPRGALAGTCRRRSARAGRSSAAEAGLPRRGRRALRVRRRQRRGRIHLLGDRSPSAATARARGCPRMACSTPACSRRTARACGMRCAAGASDEDLLEMIRGLWLKRR